MERSGTWTLRRPFLVAGLTAFGAALVSVWTGGWISLLLCGVLLLLAFALRRRPVPVFVLLCGAVFLAAGGAYQWRCVTPVTAAAGQTDLLTGRITACPASGHMYTLSVTDSVHLPVGARVLLYASDLVAPDLGDTVTAEVSLQALSDTQTYHRADGIFLTAFPLGYDENSITVTEHNAGSLTLYLSRWRAGLVSRLRGALPGEEGTLLAAICLGDRSDLSSGVTAAFRNSGLSHLLVVSGLHLTMVSGSVLALLRLLRVGRRVAVAVTMGVTVLFMGLVGAGPSVVRAGVMCLVLLGGLLLRRPADGLNSLGLALALLVAANPYAATDAGLLLSFTATAGVLTLTPRLYTCLTACCGKGERGFVALAAGFWKSIAAGLSASIGATLPLTPLLWWFFRGISLTGLLANLLAVIPAGWSLLMGWLALVLLPFGPLWQGPLLLAAMPARWLLWVTGWLGTTQAQLPLPHLWQGVVLTALVGGCILLLCRPAYLRRRAVAVFLALAVAACALGTGLERGVVNVYVYPGDTGAALLVVQDDHAALLVTHGAALYAGQTAVADRGLVALDTVVVGESRPSQAGLLADLLRDGPAKAVYTTTAANWTAGMASPPRHLSASQTVCLWPKATLVTAPDCWQLTVGEVTLSVAVTEDAVSLSGTGVSVRSEALSAPCRLTARPNGAWHMTVC